MIQVILTLLMIYLIIGLVFGISFLLAGYKKVDETAQSAGWRLRLLWMPGAIALWPLLAVKWKQSTKVSES